MQASMQAGDRRNVTFLLTYDSLHGISHVLPEHGSMVEAHHA